jgi:phospholipid transport system substrate-binding protein
MTSLATGPAWRKATPEQQKRLQDEFKIPLVRTYAESDNWTQTETLLKWAHQTVQRFLAQLQ